jgi:hypothetical protein
MTVAVVLLPYEAEGFPIEQRLAGVAATFGPPASLTCFARAEELRFYRTRLPDLAVEGLRPGCLQGFDAIALMVCSDPDLSLYGDALDAAPNARWYCVHEHGQVLPIGRAIDTADYPFLETHAFNRYSPRNGEVDYGCYYYFPYAYLYRSVGMGPINEYGHRIEFDFRTLASRPSNHKVIACYGGSATWSVYCCHPQMFTKVIEQRLNDHCAADGLDLRFTVLNFGAPGHVVLNELIAHVLFGSLVRPDIVLAHDGSNDIGYGISCDPFLLQDHIVYQQQLEIWSRVLHDPGYSGDRTAVSPAETRTRVSASQVLRAYVSRKRQFCSIAKTGGALFVSGLQPTFLSKREYSALEQAWLFDQPRVPVSQHAGFRNVLATYRLFLERRPSIGEDLFVDLHSFFGQFGREATLMADPVHLAPEGDRIIGEHYADRIVEDLLPQLVARQSDAARPNQCL